MTTCKSPRKVMAEAFAAAQTALAAYSHKFSPKKFTQHQLFACLVLKEHQKKDYRGVVVLLADASDLREVIGLKTLPHFTTLQKACQRLMSLRNFRKLLEKSIRRILNRRKHVRYSAVDSSGFDAHHASRYFIWRRDNQQQKGKKRPKKQVSYKAYGKLMLLVCCMSHAILAAVASEGPTPDIDQLDSLVAQVPSSVSIVNLSGDAGFDSAYNHRLLRDYHGILSTFPPEHGRPPKAPQTLPADKYRRMMKRRFRDGKKPLAYRLRSQVETVISMLKRNFGSALRGRSNQSRRRDMFLKVLTHNFALWFLWFFYRAGLGLFVEAARAALLDSFVV